MVRPPPLILISLESYQPELVNLASVMMFMSLKRQQGASPGEVQPIEGRKESELLKGYLRWLHSREVNRKPVRIAAYRLTSETVAAPFPPRARAAAR
jgi:hypothetical protein